MKEQNKMENNKVKTKIIIPVDTVFDFAGDGLDGSKGKLRVDAGAGLSFNEWGRLILNLLENGGLGYQNDKLCVNSCEVASRIVGTGLKVNECKLAIDFINVVACGLKIDTDGKLLVDVEKLAGNGLKTLDCQFQIDPSAVDALADARIAENSQTDTTKTVVIPYCIDIEFRHKPSGYGYSTTFEIVKTFSTLTIYKNTADKVVKIAQGEIQETTQEFDLSSGVSQNVTERVDTPNKPNFYSN